MDPGLIFGGQRGWEPPPQFHLLGLLEASAVRTPSAPAILAPGRTPLAYAQLTSQVKNTIAQLNALGYGRGDRVAIVMPNGPEMAVAFLAVASGFTSAPLNPSYRADEFEFHLTDVRAGALLVSAGIPTPAIDVARALGIAVIEVRADDGGPAGTFELYGETRGAPCSTGPAQTDDLAIVLHTSGTTARPKLVPAEP